MRFGSFARIALLCLLGASGCESAHIKDAYVGLDSDGRRRSDCVKSTKNGSPNHYFVFVELLSFKEDTILTPVLHCIDGPCGAGYMSWAQTQPQNSELLEFGNIAPGKSDARVSWEQLGPPPTPGQDDYGPLPVGHFAWELYLDDHSTPDERILFTISDDCK